MLGGIIGDVITGIINFVSLVYSKGETPLFRGDSGYRTTAFVAYDIVCEQHRSSGMGTRLLNIHHLERP